MWPFLAALKLVRYLVVWKVNSPLARVPRYPGPELSRTLGTIIARRLPTREARSWNKSLSAWRRQEAAGSETQLAPSSPWPVEAVLLVYPGKLTYGQGELVLWELKLFGESADHEFFLETILPAMEEAGYTADLPRQERNSLWGHFDIHAVYAARGGCWEPLVQEGRLDLRYRANAGQWAEGMDWGMSIRRPLRRLRWVTPFDLDESGFSGKQDTSGEGTADAPPLAAVIEALTGRLDVLLSGNRRASNEARELWSAEEQAYLQRALEQAWQTSLRSQQLDPVPPKWPGRWLGMHRFSAIPAALIPYLQLASILHIGGQTHFGCGAFVLEA